MSHRKYVGTDILAIALPLAFWYTESIQDYEKKDKRVPRIPCIEQ
ncbi:MAG TPA: hypothetical protein VD694_08405 [Nitrososphaeraceae archaeon]|nr:hypothetical protein [Nitrososphaeraceae archaeon]